MADVISITWFKNKQKAPDYIISDVAAGSMLLDAIGVEEFDQVITFSERYRADLHKYHLSQMTGNQDKIAYYAFITGLRHQILGDNDKLDLSKLTSISDPVIATMSLNPELSLLTLTSLHQAIINSDLFDVSESEIRFLKNLLSDIYNLSYVGREYIASCGIDRSALCRQMNLKHTTTKDFRLLRTINLFKQTEIDHRFH